GRGGVEGAGGWGSVPAWRVTRRVMRVGRADLLTPLRPLGGVPLEPLQECPGSLRLAVPAPDPWPSRARAQVQVEVANLGLKAWPGVGFIPRHLVQLRACIRKPEEASCGSQPIPLPADVPPGGPVALAIPS